MIKRLSTFLLDIVEVIVFAIGIFFFIYLLIMRPHKISGQSMMPNFQDAEYLLTEKVTYYRRDPIRGDVVVFTPPNSTTDEYIKRVIGLPGEKIKVQEGRVYINDKLLNEPYLNNGNITNSGGFLKEGTDYIIPDDKYFVMGDNRLNSSDSRYWGPVTKKVMSGRAWVTYWPLSASGVITDIKYNLAN